MTANCHPDTGTKLVVSLVLTLSVPTPYPDIENGQFDQNRGGEKEGKHMGNKGMLDAKDTVQLLLLTRLSPLRTFQLEFPWMRKKK